MKLRDILPYINDSGIVNVWINGKIIATYNGKDSIPKECNTLYIEKNGIYARDNIIDIYCYER